MNGKKEDYPLVRQRQGLVPTTKPWPAENMKVTAAAVPGLPRLEIPSTWTLMFSGGIGTRHLAGRTRAYGTR